MKKISNELKNLVSTYLLQMRNFTDEDASRKVSETKWSKKEILGHLIDSTSNNHQRIVRALYNVADKFPAYDQNEWVRIQKCNDMNWDDLIEFWSIYNNYLSVIIALIPESAMNNPCNIGKEELATLEFVINDYMRHLKHHLEQIINIV
jgi:hypothetical protein